MTHQLVRTKSLDVLVAETQEEGRRDTSRAA